MPTEAESAIRSFIALIDKLPPRARELWGRIQARLLHRGGRWLTALRLRACADACRAQARRRSRSPNRVCCLRTRFCLRSFPVAACLVVGGTGPAASLPDPPVPAPAIPVRKAPSDPTRRPTDPVRGDRGKLSPRRGRQARSITTSPSHAPPTWSALSPRLGIPAPSRVSKSAFVASPFLIVGELGFVPFEKAGGNESAAPLFVSPR